MRPVSFRAVTHQRLVAESKAKFLSEINSLNLLMVSYFHACSRRKNHTASSRLEMQNHAPITQHEAKHFKKLEKWDFLQKKKFFYLLGRIDVFLNC